MKFKVLWDFLIIGQILLSPQVKRSVIISEKLDIYKISDELLIDLRHKRSLEIKKYQENVKLHTIIA